MTREEAEAYEAKRRAEIDNACRAVGRYFVTFSQLVWVMRRAIGRAYESDTQPVLMDALFSHLMAYDMARAFFAACTMKTQLDEETEWPIASRLRNIVIAAIEDRNQLAHGDWLLLEGFGPEAGLDPRLARFDLTSGDPRPVLRDVSVETLDRRSDALTRLTELTCEFGEICLPHPSQPHRFTVAERFKLGPQRLSLQPGPKPYASRSEFKD